MKKLTRLIYLALLVLPFSSSYAGGCSNCQVESIATGPGIDEICPSKSCALVRLKLYDGTYEAAPCSSSQNWHYVIDTSTASGKTSLQQMISAMNENRPVVVTGDNKCNKHASGNVEDFNYVYYFWYKDTMTSSTAKGKDSIIPNYQNWQ